jgi:hypothetical protein
MHNVNITSGSLGDVVVVCHAVAAFGERNT